MNNEISLNSNKFSGFGRLRDLLNNKHEDSAAKDTIPGSEKRNTVMQDSAATATGGFVDVLPKKNSDDTPLSFFESKKDQRKEKKQIQKQNRFRIIIGVLAAIVLLGTIYLGGVLFYQDRFLPNTIISGFNMSNKTLDEALKTLESAVTDRSVKIIGRNGEENQVDASQVGLVISNSPEVEATLKEQSPYEWPAHLFDNSNEIASQSQFDEAAFDQVVSALPIVSGPDIVKTENAQAEYNGTHFTVKNEVYGTEINYEALKQKIRETLINNEEEISLEKDSLYIYPAVLKDNPALHDSINKLNAALNTVVTYDFKTAQEVLDKNQFAGWLATDGAGAPVVDQNQVANYIAALADKYDTLGKPVGFNTSTGSQIAIEDWYTGWEINQPEETTQLSNIILAGQPVVREPVYSTIGRDRTLPNVITGNYLEISISNQTMWYYKDGQLVVSTPIVTGNTADGHGTPTGLYQLQAKNTNVTLRGSNADGSAYESPVTFWMPFNGGIGVHDASWRGSFGGSIFRGNGSHGCVNTPYGAAKTIYNNISVGEPVVVY